MLKPLGDRVMIEVKEEEQKSVGGIVLTSAAKEKSQSGVIVAVGPGRTLDNGTTLPISVEVNQTVIFEKYTGQEVKYDGKEYLIIHEKDIVAIVE
ncbi:MULTISPECIES: co-chaperone GroES [Vagococcus]|nr:MULTISPECIES: co-chaperone GroES [Vagococcus]HCM89246.1 co-chaperone GroES [Vagococcus sp.]